MPVRATRGPYRPRKSLTFTIRTLSPGALNSCDVRAERETARALVVLALLRPYTRIGGPPKLAVPDVLRHPLVQAAVARLDYLTPPGKARVIDKARSGAREMSPDQLREAGLTPDTWTLEVDADTDSGTVIDRPLLRATGTALDWPGLMRLADVRTVKFIHPTFCTNVDDAFHVAHWEGVPLRDIVWLTGPKARIRRVYYQSYHPADRTPFQASLPLGDVLETPPGQLPVVLAFKMNGRPVSVDDGGPVKVIVPGVYGNKSIKWLRRIVLTNDYRANDTDASEFNSDTDSGMKTKARFVNAPTEAAAGEPVPLTGIVLVGVSGIGKVQYCIRKGGDELADSDPYLNNEDWQDGHILPPPTNWGGGLERGEVPAGTYMFDSATGAPLEWPLRFTTAHWAALVPGLPAGEYEFCCRTIDGNGIAQPMPRPLPRTGTNALHRVSVTVRA